MELKVTIKNLGKFTDAEIRINKFTVFAGLNNTGKSFASKALYSRLSRSLSEINFFSKLYHCAHQLREGVADLKNEKFEDDTRLSSLLPHLKRFNDIFLKIKGVGQRDKIPEFEKNLHGLLYTCKSIGGIGANMMDKIKEHDSAYDEAEERDFIFSLFKEYVDLFGSMTEERVRKIFTTDIENMFERNFLRNFQAKKLSDLMNDKEKGISVKIETESLMLRQEEYVKDYLSNENYSSLDILDTFITDRVLYMGSPLFWQLKNALESVDSEEMLFMFGRRLSGVPGYFHDMVRALKVEYMGEPISSDALDILTGEDGIDGKVAVASTGEMIYTENDGVTVPLVQAATGVANLGVLALLIEKNTLDENTFLFIDEPEAHLHPEWQVEIVKALFKLAEAGVHVVIATHSAEILKWLEVHVKEKPEAEYMIALNHFCKGGKVKINGGDFNERLDTIQEELASPFYELFYKGI